MAEIALTEHEVKRRLRAAELLRKLRTTHGMSKTRTFRIWSGIRERCHKPYSSRYQYYGARGIKLCDRWQKFENFLADMGQAEQSQTIERINNNGDYSPENCIWASQKLQNNNKSNNRFLEYNGQRKTISQWADVIGIHQDILWKRLDRGWSIKKSLTLPLQVNQFKAGVRRTSI